MSLLKSMFGVFRSAPQADQITPSEGLTPDSSDLVGAIHQLSREVKNNPDAVDTYLALGNLFRSRGELERAVRIHSTLTVRQGLDNKLKAKAFYELGRDYKRGGFLDRSQKAFQDAHALWGDNEEIINELARLAAEAQDFERAALYYARLKKPVAQAHYLVRMARHSFAANDEPNGRKWLNRALRVYDGSVEAWMTRLSRAQQAGDWKKIQKKLPLALEKTAPELRFLLIEGLLDSSTEPFLESPGESKLTANGPESNTRGKELAKVVLPILEEHDNDVLLTYYGAWVLICSQDLAQASFWLERTLVLRSDFWPARLELLHLSMTSQPLSPVFKVQLEFFINQARQVKRFHCRNCGLKREQLFFVCPRCQSWHSIAYRMKLHE